MDMQSPDVSLAAQRQHHYFQLLNCVNTLDLHQLDDEDQTAIIRAAETILLQQLQSRSLLSSPKLVRDFLRYALAMERNEIFSMLFLDAQHRLIAHEPLFFGTIDGASVYPRVIVQRALALNAAACVAAHNHPSGVAEPSIADRRITDKMAAALQLVDIRLLDHIVVTEMETVSFADRGWL